MFAMSLSLLAFRPGFAAGSLLLCENKGGIHLVLLITMLKSASIFFGIWAGYALIKQMISDKALFVRHFPRKALRLAGFGLIFSYVASYLSKL
jgi:hypothetical protein